MHATVSTKGWIVIPAELRKKHNLNPGARVQVVDYGGVLAIVPSLCDPIEDAAGMLEGGRSLRRALLRDHHEEKRSERSRGR